MTNNRSMNILTNGSTRHTEGPRMTKPLLLSSLISHVSPSNGKKHLFKSQILYIGHGNESQ